ncbi:MAG TPA: aminodeoxychorismate lyase, partial [Eubacteriaceae bacterium]|nr:aminodeoxychorismate lyase [Eubacteriaceae bacterium]
LNPAEHDYLYFLADIYNDSKTYYSETLQEHNELQNELLR